MGIRPLPGYVLVEPIEEESVSAGGVYITEQSKDKPMKGKVVDRSSFMPLNMKDVLILDEADEDDPTMANTLQREWSKLKVGVTVIYKKWTNQEVTYKGKEYLLIHFNELLGVIDE